MVSQIVNQATTAQTPDVQNGTLDLLLSPDCWA